MKHSAVVKRLQSATGMPESAWASPHLPDRQAPNTLADDFLLDAYSRTVSQVASRARSAVAHITVQHTSSSIDAGSGFVFTTDGFLLTNSHVVHGAKKVIAAFADGAEYTARLIGEDQCTDTAVLRLEGGSMAALPLGDSRHPPMSG